MARKRHSPIAFGIVGGLLGFALAFLASIPYASYLQEQDVLLTSGEAYEQAGQNLAPFIVLVTGVCAYLAVRWAKKKNQNAGQ